MNSTTKTERYTAEWHREQAAQCRRRSAESFERCDTDGFLSQWASDVTARRHELDALVAEQDGTYLFRGLRLEQLDGTPVDARVVDTRYGLRWRVDATDEWLPVAPKREATLAKRGYREVRVEERHPAITVWCGGKYDGHYQIVRADGVRGWIA